ncbi:MAG: UDP-2,4-diacetamido-2,4,6-trideoxy-beta-L-altropyranose hydrolase [Gammaproteobacteria bacterium]|nr:UDP-2,4-diacetamido-2,4,6-trideoxy-beta-L-altropyranose hydrolase [Gammaproteobacteria bacterium]
MELTHESVSKLAAQPWTVAICADASRQIGSGHLMRCLSLARALRQIGAEVRFYYAAWPGHADTWLNAQGFHGELLDFAVDNFLADEDAKDSANVWSPLWQQQYGHACVKAWQPWLQSLNTQATSSVHRTIDWCIYDNYGLAADFVKVIKPSCRQLMAIDDLANREHPVDLLLDQNAVFGMQTRYQTMLPADCTQLLGPQYALLRPEFYSSSMPITAQTSSARSYQQVNRILVSIGGSDTVGLTERLCKLLFAQQVFADISLDVVVGSAYEKITELTELIAARANSRLFVQTNEMASLMRQADLAIGAGGSSQWERALTHLPSLVVAVADNQQPGCEYLQHLGAIQYLGRVEQVSDELLLNAITEIIENKDLRQALAERAYALMAIAQNDASPSATQVLYSGAEKVARKMSFLSTLATLALRQAETADAELLFTWANDPYVRAMAFSKAPIAWATHLAWFEQKRQDASTDIWICEQFGQAVGQCRLNAITPLIGEIHLNLNPACRGLGLAAAMIAKASQASIARHQWQEIHAVVKLSNHASLRAFIRAGFQPTRQEQCYGEECQWFSFSPTPIAKS